MNIATEATLAKKGDQNAFIRLIQYFEPDLYRVAHAILKRDEDCADAIQNAVLLAYETIYKLRQPPFFKTWLIRILINECNQILRKQKKVFHIEEMREITTHNYDLELIELKMAVEKLEDPLKIVIILHYFEDLSVKEIAEILSLPEGTVKSRLHRARQVLQARWKPQERMITNE